MNLNIIKAGDFYSCGKLGVSIFQKKENKYMYIPSKSGLENILFVISLQVNYVDMLDVNHVIC